MADNSYPIFKGLQKPLEFMGVRGRFLVYAAATGGASFLGFAVGNIIGGTLAGIITMALMAGGGYVFILIRQKQGMHTKKKFRGTVIYTNLFRR